MKKTVLYFIFGIALCLSSCNVHEEISFSVDGSVSYKMQYNISKMMIGETMNFEASGFPSDTVISLKELGESGGSKAEYPEQEEDIANIAPLFLTVNSNDEDIAFSISGNFDDIAAMQQSMKSFTRLSEKESEKKRATEGETVDMTQELLHSAISQEGVIYSFSENSFTRKASNISSDSDESSDLDETLSNIIGGNMLSEMLPLGKYIMKYNFPRKVKSVDNSNAIISEDRKSVVIEYSLSEIMASPQGLDISVEF